MLIIMKLATALLSGALAATNEVDQAPKAIVFFLVDDMVGRIRA